MHLDLDDNEFRAGAELWLSTLGSEVVVRFESVVNASPGYYPTTLYQLWLAELARRGLEPETLPASRSRPATLPVGHPLDADWRFTTSTATRLLDLALTYADPCDRMVHIGTPTTFQIATRQQPAIHHVLIERSEPIVASLVRAGHDPSDLLCVEVGAADIPALQASAAIIDPPWYLPDTVAFLTAGAVACRMGATLLLCQPTTATRPGVAVERQRLDAALPVLGLSLTEIHVASVRYVTPHFETMSLRLANPALPDLPTWRVGDVMILRKEGEPDISLGCVESRSPRWADIEFGPVRIKIRLVSSDASSDMATLVPGDVLRTVSRRDPARDRVGFWTSGNRVFGLAHPEQIAQLVRRCAADLARQRFTLTRTLEHARHLGVARSTARQLFDVLLIELQEHRAFGRT